MHRLSQWFPIVAFVFLVFMLTSSLPTFGIFSAVIALIGVVLSAVHHAEIIAHRVGEPFGTLVLAVSITIIEVGLIFSLMLVGGESKSALARDTIYATLMIICSGVVGLSILAGSIKHKEQSFKVDGVASSLAALTVLSIVSLILPNFTTSAPGAFYSVSQIAFVATISLCLWSVFVYAQSGRHRDYFLPSLEFLNEDTHAIPPTKLQAIQSTGYLILSLVCVVGLARGLSPNIEQYLKDAGAPLAAVGVLIALIVLLPETGAAIRASLSNRFQASINLALGSALASMGLTIPAVAILSVIFDMPLVLGLGSKEMILLVTTLLTCIITFSSGRTNLMLGAVHLVLFFSFLVLTFLP